MTHLGERHDDPLKDMVWAGGERRLLNVELLIKTLKLIPSMVLFGD